MRVLKDVSKKIGFAGAKPRLAEIAATLAISRRIEIRRRSLPLPYLNI